MSNKQAMLQEFNEIAGAKLEIVPLAEDPKKILLHESTFKQNEGWILLKYTKSRTVGKTELDHSVFHIHEGKMERLQKYHDLFLKYKELPGKIQVKEYLLSEVPEDYVRMYLTPADYYSTGITPKTVEDLIYKHSKKKQKNGPALTYNSEIIMYFTEWDQEGDKEDILAPEANGSTCYVNNVRYAEEKPQVIGSTRFKLPDVKPL
jgi:hypothetical protein